ncbi:MAG: AbrB/MazE/SpoVT family DNA-binding domain-containing protein [Deltaproteobacteria bacterium]|nr:AbrB/MazE/SpoVT family DNA-binding domain-containing protein [Deltaproteobacteria bacterium]
MRITTKGQVTIPQRIREQVGLHPDTEVELVVDGNAVRIIKKTGSQEGEGRGRQVLRRLRGRATVSMSTDEIMALTRDEP